MPNVIEIKDINDPFLDPYARMTENQLKSRIAPEKGVFIAESKTVVSLAMDAGYEPISVLMERFQLNGPAKELASRLGENVPIYTADSDILQSLTGFKLSRGVFAVMKRPVLPSVKEICQNAKKIAVLENIVDSTNMGAIIRSAAALGIDAVLVTRGCCDPLLRRAARVSMGTVFQIPWTYIGDSDTDWPGKGLDLLHSLGFTTVAMALSGNTVNINDECLKREERLAVILGTEGTGLCDETINACDFTAKIPMYHGVDSLNVAAASAVAFWEISDKK